MGDTGQVDRLVGKLVKHALIACSGVKESGVKGGVVVIITVESRDCLRECMWMRVKERSWNVDYGWVRCGLSSYVQTYTPTDHKRG